MSPRACLYRIVSYVPWLLLAVCAAPFVLYQWTRLRLSR